MDFTRPVRIAAASREDLQSVATLAREIWRRHYPPIIGVDQTEYMLARMYAMDVLERLLDTPGAALDLLFVERRLAGFVAYCTGVVPAELKLDKLYVHHDYHGAGYGSRLIERAEAAARDRGCIAIVLNVHQRNAIAIRAYKRHGFVVRKAFANDFGNGHAMDDYEMVKYLQSA